MLIRPLLLLPFLAAALTTAAQAEPSYIDTLLEQVGALGRLNGQALACQQKEAAARIKSVMINRVPKTREFGDTFEQATTTGFLKHKQTGGACPPVAVMTVSIEMIVQHFPTAVAAGSLDNDAPDIGINPRYLLQATNGRTILDGDFPRHFQLISFGYTFCPDICPTTLTEMAEVMRQLGEQAKQVQPIFISVDPARDTLPQLGKYLAFFDERIIGATGSADLIKRAADNFKVKYEKVLQPGADPNNYAMDHSAGMYLLAPGGQFIAKFPYATPVNVIVERLRHEIRITPPPPGADNPPSLRR